MGPRLRAAAGAALLSWALVGCAAASGQTGGALPAGTDSGAGAVTVFAAASLSAPFDELARAFEANHPGVRVEISYDGSSTLVEQIRQGAPAGVIATADHATMAHLSDAGLLASPPQDFATNDLTIGVPAANPAQIASLADLARPGVQVVRCAPAVPCGALADQALTAAKATLSGASEEQSVSAVAAKVAAGDADAGLMYTTDVAASRGRIVEVPLPAGVHPTTRYPIAAVRGASALDRQFVDFVVSSQVRRVLTAYGFGEP